MSRKIVVAFAVVQSVGVTCSWGCGYNVLGTGPAMWVIAWIILIPGDVVSGLVVEKLLWSTRLTLAQLGIIHVLVGLTINAFAWFACVRLWWAVKSASARAS